MVYPAFPQVAEVAKALSLRYHDNTHRNRRNAFEELLFILCSLQTNEKLYSNTYAKLRHAYPRFNELAEAAPADIAESLRTGGLYKQKAQIISQIAKTLRVRYGRVTLSPLSSVGTEGCEAFLTSLPGVGKKTARCIMMYSLQRQVFPFDTHCWRICRRWDGSAPRVPIGPARLPIWIVSNRVCRTRTGSPFTSI
jgi:endonuclease III